MLHVYNNSLARAYAWRVAHIIERQWPILNPTDDDDDDDALLMLLRERSRAEHIKCTHTNIVNTRTYYRMDSVYVNTYISRIYYSSTYAQVDFSTRHVCTSGASNQRAERSAHTSVLHTHTHTRERGIRNTLCVAFAFVH